MNNPFRRTRLRALLWLVLLPLAAAADEITDALDASLAAQRAARESQARIDRLDNEARALRQKQQAAEWRALQLSAYAAQLEQEAAAEEAKRAQIEAELGRIAATGTDLMPLMRRMVDGLESFIAGDLPFLVEARRQRVAELRALLDDPRRGNADKFRRLLEAYRTEVDYGYSLGVEERADACGDAAGPSLQVRVGRVALYCLAGERAAAWEAETRRWHMLDEDAVGEVRRAAEVARGAAPPQLLVVPVRAASKATP